eukprot:NODE_100_length_20777_cov_0.240884.p24 type:complete len:110 gc:universal NODE_100_length_20777_cov_0.240884:2975-3304(+)
MECMWNHCGKLIEQDDIKAHLNAHIGYKRDHNFQGNCRWMDKSNCTYIGNSRHLLLSHLKRHYNGPIYTCKFCKIKKYKWSHDLLKHERKCKMQTFQEIVDLLFDGLTE